MKIIAALTKKLVSVKQSLTHHSNCHCDVYVARNKLDAEPKLAWVNETVFPVPKWTFQILVSRMWVALEEVVGVEVEAVLVVEAVAEAKPEVEVATTAGKPTTSGNSHEVDYSVAEVLSVRKGSCRILDRLR